MMHDHFNGAFEMAAKGVNLDALIPREDFDVDGGQTTGTADSTISIHHLASNNFFVSSLRKPDFQRETVNWTPDKIVDLITAFLDGDLIPAIILWKSGQFIFVIDGAHRLSALLAWIYDDYGDRSRSLNFFGNVVSEEQKKLAEKTRDLVAEKVRPFAEYRDALNNMFDAPEHLKKRLSVLNSNSFVAQWVPAVDAEGAQNSFFKINQQATPIDPIERRILKARTSATAIASRAITHAGTGHKYWQKFDRKVGEEIERLGKEIYGILYKPPMSQPVKTSDVPIAGRGYSALPFVFDLVTQANDVGVKDSTAGRNIRETLPEDEDGQSTLDYLKKVRTRLKLISTNSPGALGVHPLVYFYTRSGSFQPAAFHAVLNVLEKLRDDGNLNRFTDVRQRFESFLVSRKEVYSMLVTKLGSGARSRPAIERFFHFVLQAMWDGKSDEAILTELGAQSDFMFLASEQPQRSGAVSKKGFSTSTKSAAFITELENSGVRCGICKGLIHANSVQTDHIVPKKDGGSNHSGNAQVSHPYCNSTYKQASG